MDSTSILLNEENSIRVVVNGDEKLLAKEWLAGDGRAVNTILAKQILGTEEGFQGTKILTLNEELFPYFDLVIDWLCKEDDHTRLVLSAENAVQLNDLALYFGLDGLLNVIQEVKRERQQRIANLEEYVAKLESNAAALELQFVFAVEMISEQEAHEMARLNDQRMNDSNQLVRDFALQQTRDSAQQARDSAQRVRDAAQRTRDVAQNTRDVAQQIRGSFPCESIPTTDHSSV